MTPCYKNFTLILAGQSSGEQSNLRLSKKGSDGHSTSVYQEVCRFCKKERISYYQASWSYRGKKVGLAKLGMKEAELLIKQRAREKGPDFFYRNRECRLDCKKLLVLQDQRKIVIQQVGCISKNNAQNVSCIHIRIVWRWRMVLFSGCRS